MTDPERRAQWATWDDTSTETVFERFENGGWVVEGIVSGLEVQYVIRLGEDWAPRQLLLFRDQDEPDLWLATDGQGHWGEINGVERTELFGCTDVHVAGTVYPTVLPMRRLTAAGAIEVAEVRTIVIDAENLSVRPAVHRYERVGDQRWKLGHGTEVTVDGAGFPLDVEGVWRRLV